MNKIEITLEKIEKIKEQAEDIMTKIILKVEKETGCIVQDVSMFVDNEIEDDNKRRKTLEIDLNLRLPFRIFKKE